MPSNSWVNDWITGDIVPASEFRKSLGCIFDTTLGAGAASIDATSLPTTYAHLMLIAYLRSDTAAQATDFLVRFNGDSAANYAYATSGVASNVSSPFANAATTSILSGNNVVAAASATAGGFSAFWMEIPHYGGTANHKSAVFSCGTASSTTECYSTGVGVWRSTAAINRITISLAAGNIVTGSRFSIYVMGS